MQKERGEESQQVREEKEREIQPWCIGHREIVWAHQLGAEKCLNILTFVQSVETNRFCMQKSICTVHLYRQQYLHKHSRTLIVYSS